MYYFHSEKFRVKAKNQYALEKNRETSLKEEAARRNLQSNNQGLKLRVVAGRGTR
jgi:hypothetical protein